MATDSQRNKGYPRRRSKQMDNVFLLPSSMDKQVGRLDRVSGDDTSTAMHGLNPSVDWKF